MALDDSQKVNVRRWAGYPLMADNPATDSSDIAYVHTRNAISTLEHRLNNLTTAEESVLVDVYLDKLETLETDVLKAGDNIDTLEAGPWKSNPRELGDRQRLFNSWRRQMCAFMGLEPGPGLGDGGLTLVRC